MIHPSRPARKGHPQCYAPSFGAAKALECPTCTSGRRVPAHMSTRIADEWRLFVVTLGDRVTAVEARCTSCGYTVHINQGILV